MSPTPFSLPAPGAAWLQGGVKAGDHLVRDDHGGHQKALQGLHRFPVDHVCRLVASMLTEGVSIWRGRKSPRSAPFLIFLITFTANLLSFSLLEAIMVSNISLGLAKLAYLLSKLTLTNLTSAEQNFLTSGTYDKTLQWWTVWQVSLGEHLSRKHFYLPHASQKLIFTHKFFVWKIFPHNIYCAENFSTQIIMTHY